MANLHKRTGKNAAQPMTELPLGIHYGIAREIYERDPGYRQSTLKHFGQAQSPFHYLYEQNNPPKRAAHLRIGDCVDSAIADSAEVHASKFVIYEERRQGKAWDAFEEKNAGKVILNRTEANTVTDCVLALARHDDTQKILAACNKQVCVIANHAEHGWRLKGLLDLLPDRTRCSDHLTDHAFDLKTAIDASPEGFSDACFKFGYAIQAAFYTKLLEYNHLSIFRFGFIVVETVPPHQVAIHYIERGSAEFAYGISQIERLLPAYHRCVTENSWLSYGDQWNEVRFKRYQLQAHGIERETLV